MVAFVMFTIVIAAWLWLTGLNQDPCYVNKWWNRRIKGECDEQDSKCINGIPSYQDAWHCCSKTATELHRLIRLNHDDILAEVEGTIGKQDGTMVDDIAWNQSKWLKKEDGWCPIWVRFMGDWSKYADKLPTLKRIVSAFPDVTALHISIFKPGTALVQHRGVSRAVHRYHYGLKIPYGDVGLKIAGYNVKWGEKEGYIWDDTLPHSAWNHTPEPRIVIFADIFRQLSIINSLGSKVIYSLLQETKQVSRIKTLLQQEGIPGGETSEFQTGDRLELA